MEVLLYKSLTGHMYYRSLYETASDCGNCDGAKCDSCKLEYVVEDLNDDKIYYRGPNKDEAERIEKELTN